MSPGISTRLLATQSDERLLTLVAQGHERAFEAIVHRYRKQLLGYCRRLRLTEARAEDIVQLALLKTWIAVREGAEVRDLKAWLYRVVHNTAVNAMRDGAHDGQPLADPFGELGGGALAAGALTAGVPSVPARTQRLSSDDSPLDRRIEMRETLAEVAALPPLQREVLVRTAVAGHSHEQVASDLGISNGAVRGLLYRARTTLRTAVTALTPPPLLSWLAGRSQQGGPGTQRITELAAGAGVGAGGVGGAAGMGGLLLKGGAVALTAGTVITGAVVHFSATPHHRNHHPQQLAAVAPARHAAGVRGVDGGAASTLNRDLAASSGARGGDPTGRVRRLGSPHAGARGGSRASHPSGSSGALAPGGQRGATAPTLGGTNHYSVKVRTDPGSPGSAQGSSPSAGAGGSGETSNSGASQPGGAGAGSASAGGSGGGGASEGGAGSVQPGAGSGSGSGSDPGSGSSGSGSGAGSGSGSGSSGSGSGSGSGAGSGTGSSGSGSEGAASSPSGESGSESSGEHSGSLVGTVVHEVGNVLEHLLH
jgi:RNA polymerase sigma factor (sigma-70 family)